MTTHHSKQARIDALIQDLTHLKAEYITDDQLARMTEIINIASVQSQQHTATDRLADRFFQTENLIKKLDSDIASLQNSDLLINNEIRLLDMQKQLKLAQESLTELAGLIQHHPEELARFRQLERTDHLPITLQLHERAQS